MNKEDFLIVANRLVQNKISTFDIKALVDEYFVLENKDGKYLNLVTQTIINELSLSVNPKYIYNLLDYFCRKYECTKIIEGKTNKIIKIL